ncbi:iron-containing alcohol dehydrogenase [Sutterella sp.]|uniref:iron-containing alcohol dehydrogenase n=1 Tax=Sutterella sp. TaxID=1981025 RepID=UPI0026E1086D|nr:iron-containing alcohol dehydrogenase [Sutterella sp.]MDO5532782.1 iron-containing alcohol dehydrogenase [Sutterella sp.]
MQSFDLYLPTHLVFGKGRVSELGNLVAGRGKRVLITYGGGSVVRSGLLADVKAQLAGFEVFEFSGIEPNPKIESVRRAVELCREKSIDFMVAVGGGSVIDATKAIAAGVFYQGDAWDLLYDSSKIGRTLPFFAVLTLAATGSEYDNTGVISNPETDEKLFLGAPNLFPVASILDPTYTQTVPAWHTAAGAADIMSHTFEQYLVAEGNDLTDGFCESMLRAVIRNTPKAIANPDDYDARAEILLASSFGCCGLLAIGRTPSPWPCHGIEHEISAFTDITHGAGLAIITPHWMRYSLTEATAPRFAQYGVNVWGLDPKGDVMENARKAIDCTAEFFVSIGLPAKLSDLGVTDEHFEEMADHLLTHWYPFDGALRPLDRDGILAILRASL